MPTIEENAKKIETLSRVARLLGDQIREQNKKIELLENELLKLKQEVVQGYNSNNFSDTRTTKELLDIPSVQSQEQKAQDSEVLKVEKQTIGKESSEKEQLKQALKIIDNL